MRVQVLSLRLATVQLTSLACMSLCLAGPPSVSGLQNMATVARSVSLPSLRRPTTPVFGNHGPRTLDLRPPELPKTNDDDFPGTANRHLLGSETKHTSSLADFSMTKPMSPAEAFARRVHKEGLPVARLWETHSALVSIGLNPKGKPGLWLIQKTH
jgi:hypothetical protein